MKIVPRPAPLSEHLKDYKQLMMQYYGAELQACYRGPRLYDTEETKSTVIEVIDWYTRYRDILNSDVLHLRRADGRDWDGILHVNHEGKERGLAMLYNPLKEAITRTLKLPVYYTGKHDQIGIRKEEGGLVSYAVDRDYMAEITVETPAEGYTWLVIE